jgi:hypothetical protein
MVKSFYWYFQIFLLNAAFRFQSFARRPPKSPVVRLRRTLSSGVRLQAMAYVLLPADALALL